MTDTLNKVFNLSGGKIALAVSLGLDRTACYSWKEVPSERVLAVSELINWQVTPHEMRPDLYPNPTDAMPLVAA